MITPVILWTAIIGLFVAIVVVRFAVEMIRYFHEDHSQSIFSTDSKFEQFFVPGDPDNDEEDYTLYDED